MNVNNTTLIKDELKHEKYVCSAESFSLGELSVTQGVAALLNENLGASLSIILIRHRNGDWGNIPIEDKRLNDEATKSEGRIMSSYQLCDQRVWVITESDRSVTTVLFPSEY